MKISAVLCSPACLALVLAAPVTLPRVGLAQHAGDVLLEVVNERITTGLLGEDFPEETLHDARVFPATFGEIIPNFADEPGFDAAPGTFDFPGSVGFNVRAGLKKWTGSGWVSAAPVTLTIQYATERVTVADAPLAGFLLPVAPNGEWHRHFDFTLNAPATDGIYLLEWEMVSDDSSLAASAPFFTVFNQNRAPAEHKAALDWVALNLVPGMKFYDPVLAAGQNNVIRVIGCSPGANVTFIYGFADGFTNVPQCPGVAAWISAPTVAGSVRADATGLATFRSFIPASTSGRTIYVQAIDQRNCTIGNLLEWSFP